MDTTTPRHYSLVVADLRLELSSLEAKEAELAEKIGQLRQAIAFIEDRMTRVHPEERNAEADREGPYSQLSLIEAAAQYLEVVGRPADTRSIADALVKGGYKTKAKNLYNNVYGSLNRESEKASPRIVKKGTKWDLPNDEGDTDNDDSNASPTHFSSVEGGSRESADHEIDADEIPT